MEFLGLLGTATELGLMSSLVVLALFLSYQMLGVCDLSTDGCFTFGAAVGAMVALAGYPWLSLLAAVAAGWTSGLIVALLQTKLGVDSLLAGIVVNTGLYSVGIAVMRGSSLANLNFTKTIFSEAKDLVAGTFLSDSYKLIVASIFVLGVAVALGLFLRTRLGLAVRATGDNPAMVRSSSINPRLMTTIGLTVSGGITALAGCLLAQAQKSVNIDIGSGMVTVALASLLIGNVFSRKMRIPFKLLFAVIGAILFRLVYTVALRFNLPAYMLKLVSSVIVVAAIALPYLGKRYPAMRRRIRKAFGRKEKENA